MQLSRNCLEDQAGTVLLDKQYLARIEASVQYKHAQVRAMHDIQAASIEQTQEAAEQEQLQATFVVTGVCQETVLATESTTQRGSSSCTHKANNAAKQAKPRVHFVWNTAQLCPILMQRIPSC